MTKDQLDAHLRRRPDLHSIEGHGLDVLKDVLIKRRKDPKTADSLNALRKQVAKELKPTVVQRVRTQAAAPAAITAGGALAAIASTIGMALINSRRPGFANTYFP